MRKLALALVPLLASACADEDVLVARQLPAAVAEDALAVAEANNQFALDVLATLDQEGANQFFSPFSISTALWMLDAGAAGVTDTELRTALHAALPGERAHVTYGALLDSLDVGRGYGAYTLATADRLFGQDGTSFLDAFLKITADDYKAPLQRVDFGDPVKAAGTINSWVSDQTDGKIPKLLTPEDVESATLALVNAILFKGKWEHQFEADQTLPGPFTLASGAIASVPMMHKEDALALGALDGGHIGILPFRGKDLSMVILLPDDAGGLAALEHGLTGASLRAAIDGAKVVDDKIPVALPKFAIEASLDLKDTLGKLGIVSAFDPATADLSGITGSRGLFVQRAVHKAVISVDEQGAEAAAATAIVAGDAAPADSFIVDRPFAFMIYDHVTHSVLFLGHVTDPR